MPPILDLAEYSHRRYNPFTGEYVLVSPHRSKRPWQGKHEPANDRVKQAYNSYCYLCPTNARAGGEKNPDYSSTYVFMNDFAAIMHDAPPLELEEGDFFKAKSEKGICKVICFSPDHSLTIPELHLEQVVKVVLTWKDQYQLLGSLPFINYVQIFENKGEVMGCSNPHPHGQIWAQETVPDEPQKKQRRFKEYFLKKESSMVVDYVHEELKKGERVIYENSSFVVLVPFWATWPFEAMIAPKVHIASVSELSTSTATEFADAYQILTAGYDRLFNTSFPYSAGIHQAPTDGTDHPEWDMHMLFYPPLLRSATVKKFMVGYEMFANPQRDITPEMAAKLLCAACSGNEYGHFPL